MASVAEFAIEKGIPFPVPSTTAGRYPFDQMDVGDSFLADVAHGSKGEGAVRSAAYNHAKDGRKFTVRRCDGGLRVWRVA